MKNQLRNLSIAVTAAMLSVSTSFADLLPAGTSSYAFRGKSSQIKDKNDFMSLLIRKDEKNAGSYYMILAEYALKDIGIGRATLEKLTPHSNELALVNWVPRMYIYRADKVSELEYTLKPLMVTASGDIEVNASAQASRLKLDKENTMVNATLTRLDEKTGQAESVTFNNKRTLRGNSTWEPYVSGKYFGTTNSTGGDYFKKTVNTELTEDRIAKFNRDSVTGEFNVVEKLPGMFVLQARDNVNKGKETVEGKIVVFVDIVNWKSFGIDRFTTEEMLIINPDNASDVGFYYERHYNIKDEEAKKKADKKK